MQIKLCSAYYILLVKIIEPSLQPTFFIYCILNFWTDFTIYIFYYLTFSGWVYNKKSKSGPTLHLTKKPLRQTIKKAALPKYGGGPPGNSRLSKTYTWVSLVPSNNWSLAPYRIISWTKFMGILIFRYDFRYDSGF